MKAALKRILVPTDLTELSTKALSYAAALAEKFDAEIYILHVIEDAPFAAGLEAVAITKTPEEECASMREELNYWLAQNLPSQASTQTLLREGKPASEIVAAAKEHNIDLILIPSHAHRLLPHIFSGSTAEKVFRRAPCPVMTVHEREHEFVTAE